MKFPENDLISNPFRDMDRYLIYRKKKERETEKI